MSTLCKNIPKSFQISLSCTLQAANQLSKMWKKKPDPGFQNLNFQQNFLKRVEIKICKKGQSFRFSEGFGKLLKFQKESKKFPKLVFSKRESSLRFSENQNSQHFKKCQSFELSKDQSFQVSPKNTKF
jgi:hypothetical protein